MKTMKLFSAAAILAIVSLGAASCINEDYDLNKLDTEMTLVPGLTFAVDGSMNLSMTRSHLTKSGDTYVYEQTVTAAESGINFSKFAAKVGTYSKHFQIVADIVNGTEYDMNGTVDIYGGETRVEMGEKIAAKKTTQVVADVYCDGSLEDIEKAVFHINVEGGSEGLWSESMPDVQIRCREIVLVDGINIKL